MVKIENGNRAQTRHTAEINPIEKSLKHIINLKIKPSMQREQKTKRNKIITIKIIRIKIELS